MFRDPSDSESSHIAEVFRRLQDHFHEWPGYVPGNEHDLVGFAYYEGCGDSDHCGDILAEAAPFALGAELVSRHGFTWVMIKRETEWRYGVMHSALRHPIDLTSLEDGSWNEEEPSERGRGATTHASLETILKRTGLTHES